MATLNNLFFAGMRDGVAIVQNKVFARFSTVIHYSLVLVHVNVNLQRTHTIAVVSPKPGLNDALLSWQTVSIQHRRQDAFTCSIVHLFRMPNPLDCISHAHPSPARHLSQRSKHRESVFRPFVRGTCSSDTSTWRSTAISNARMDVHRVVVPILSIIVRRAPTTVCTSNQPNALMGKSELT